MLHLTFGLIRRFRLTRYITLLLHGARIDERDTVSKHVVRIETQTHKASYGGRSILAHHVRFFCCHDTRAMQKGSRGSQRVAY